MSLEALSKKLSRVTWDLVWKQRRPALALIEWAARMPDPRATLESLFAGLEPGEGRKLLPEIFAEKGFRDAWRRHEARTSSGLDWP